ncbi:hypothetical protein SBA6_440012 [Candidatus Sulfopaludibacter sp. SbA6]|nr:hypothetical protein SBA6_440012 [Candidatus Sulfopaludibacter sp. SbA6]
MSDDSDPYLYPGTDVLKNVPGLRDSEQLAAFEALNTGARSYELLQSPIAGGFDIAHLKAIHKHIFQDVFTWAGEFRTTVLGKAEYLGQHPAWFTAPRPPRARGRTDLRVAASGEFAPWAPSGRVRSPSCSIACSGESTSSIPGGERSNPEALHRCACAAGGTRTVFRRG